MQNLTFTEIRQRYKEKYEKRLSGIDTVLEKKLEWYQVYQDDGPYFIKVWDKQKECERIVDFLYIKNKALHEPDAVKKYHLLLQTLPEDYRLKFQDTIRRHEGYTQHLINNRKNIKTQMMHSFKALKTMLCLMDKEITEYSDEELAELIKDKSFTTTTKQHIVWFLKYCQMQRNCCP